MLAPNSAGESWLSSFLSSLSKAFIELAWLEADWMRVAKNSAGAEETVAIGIGGHEDLLLVRVDLAAAVVLDEIREVDPDLDRDEPAVVDEAAAHLIEAEQA